MFLMASAAGFGQEDDSAVVKVFQQIAGIPLPAKRMRGRASAPRKTVARSAKRRS
jgi:hypothetical protein